MREAETPLIALQSEREKGNREGERTGVEVVRECVTGKVHKGWEAGTGEARGELMGWSGWE